MGCRSHWDPLGVWLTWVTLPAWELDWLLYLGVTLLVAYCCSLYYCCGLWVQGSAFFAKGPSQKRSSSRLCGEEPRKSGLLGKRSQMIGQLREAVSHSLENGPDKLFP